MKRIVFVVVIAAVLFAAVSCSTKISSVKQDPAAWADKKVTVSGTVMKVHLVPNTPINLISLYDKTDTMLVLTNEEVKRNETITVSGEIVLIGGRMDGQRATYVQRKIAEFLVVNGITKKEGAYPVSKRLLVYLQVAVRGAPRSLLLLESKVY